MRELVETIVKSLVDHESEVSVKQVDGTTSSIIEVNVNKDDVGKVIGKQGNTAKAIRTILKASGKKQNRMFRLNLV
jgi:predicted RNA-binding protein YlqC (UPF0109 family)